MKYPAQHKTWLRSNPFKRARRAMSQSSEDIALQVGVHPTTYMRWECGMTRPSPEHTEILAKVLNWEPTTLIGEYEIWRALKP